MARPGPRTRTGPDAPDPGDPPPTHVREATRLEDGLFAQMATTPHGVIPCLLLRVPSPGVPPLIPDGLAEAWGVSPEANVAVALDVETAATVGGPREVPFAIGLAHDEGETVALAQVILRGLDDEPAALWLIDERLRRASFCLTYNGARFDLPLLRRRWEAVWGEAYTPPCPSIDLEPLVRAVWGGGGATTLASLEEHLLAVVRRTWAWHPMWHDLDAGFSWRQRKTLARILAKNAQDVVSLVWLFTRIVEAAGAGSAPSRLCLFVARGLARKDPSEAARWYERAASGALDRPRLQAALEAWRLTRGASHVAREALEAGALGDFPESWRAAERLGLAAWRDGRRAEALRWTELALGRVAAGTARRRLQARVRRWREAS